MLWFIVLLLLFLALFGGFAVNSWLFLILVLLIIVALANWNNTPF